MLELNGDLPRVAMHGVGELGEALDHEVVGNAETEIKAVAAAGHIGGFDDIHAYAALGALLFLQLLHAAQSLLVASVGPAKKLSSPSYGV